MTIEEKRAAMKEACHTHHPCCYDGKTGGCPLFKNHPGWEWCDLEDDDYVETFYDQVCGTNEVEVTDEAADNVNHPSHYTQGGMECIDEMLLIFGKEAVKHFCICNAWKYRKRAMFKNGQEDIDKSDWYINKYKELSADGTAIR